MHRIDAPGNRNGKFWSGNPFAVPPIPSTIVNADWGNSVQEELLSVIEGVGRAPQKLELDQLRKSIQDMIDASGGGSLQTNDRVAIDQIAPVGLGPQGFRELWSVCRWQDNENKPGIRITPLGSGLAVHKIAHAWVPPTFLAHGGEIELMATGEFTPGSTNPTLQVKLELGGDLLRPFDTVGVLGWAWNNSSTGKAILQRYPANSRWVLRVRLISLGKDAHAHPAETHGGNDGQLITEGYLDLHYNLNESHGVNQERFDPATEGQWTSGTAYALGAQVWRHREPYVCVAPHTAGTADAPGTGADWVRYWAPKRRRFEILGSHEITGIADDDADMELVLNIGAPFHGDYEGASAWATSTSYTVLDVVTHGGKWWMAMVTHTSSSADEPESGSGDWEAFWQEVPKAGNDIVQVDYTRAALYSGHIGAEWGGL